MADLGVIVNLVASGMMALFGVAAVIVAGDRRRGAALAVYCVGFAGGTAVVGAETILGHQTPTLEAVRLVLYACGGVGAFLFASTLARGPESRGRRRIALVAGLLFPAAWSTHYLINGPLPARAFGDYTFLVLVGGAMAGSFLLALQHRSLRPSPASPTQARSTQRTLAIAGAALLLYPAFYVMSDGVYNRGLKELLLTAAISLPVVLLGFAWALAGGPGKRAGPRNVSLVLVACALGGLAIAVARSPGLDNSFTRFGIPGVTRLAGVALLAYCVFRLDLLHTNFHAHTARRGTLATVALASLFIVAQVAQNFFAAQYGLLMGGVVAGTLVFAASPIQRAMERAGGRTPVESEEPMRRSTEHDSASRRESLYRDALRFALLDRKVTREEELHLFRLAEELGIGAGRAMELRLEVEAGQRRGPKVVR